MLIFKIVPAAEWETAVKAGHYDGSAKDREDGFLHFSTGEQVPGTLEKHYAGQSGLLLVAVETGALGDALKWEKSRGGALFPHLHGPLPTDAVRWTRPLDAP